MTDKDILLKVGKKIKLPMTKCKKCKGSLDIQITTELSKEDEKRGLTPQVLLIYGSCHKCKIVYMLNIIPFKDIPKVTDKQFRKLSR